MQTYDSDGDFSNAEEDIRVTDKNIRATEANIRVTDNNIRVTDEDGEDVGERETGKTVETDTDTDRDNQNGVNTGFIDDTINNNNNSLNKSISSSTKTNIKTINNNSITRPLTFGIDSILKVRVNSVKERKIGENGYCHETVNEHESDKTNELGYTGEHLGISHTSDDDDDDEQDTDELRLKSAAFEAEAVRARIALLRYSTTAFSAFNAGNGNGGRTGSIQQTVFPPSFSLTNTGSGGYAWPSVSANAGDVVRKDRYEFVRRVGHPYQNRTPPKRKKPRTSFTRLQILELEKRFERQKYLASTERSALAKSLKMSDGQVKTWFQNRRTKWRRQTAEEREIERQAANRLLLSLQAETSHRKSVGLSSDPVCLSHFQRWQDQRSADV